MILSNVCFFMFTIIDAVFVGRGVGTNALGAINLVSPFIMVVGAINMLISVGGVAIYAVRIGRGDILSLLFHLLYLWDCKIIAVMTMRPDW